MKHAAAKAPRKRRNAPGGSGQRTLDPARPGASCAWPSMASAAGAIGVPRERLSEIKQVGCPAFPASGRVDGMAMLRWLLEERVARPAAAPSGSSGPIDEPASLQEAKRLDAWESAQARRQKRLVQLGTLISRERHEAIVRRALEAGLRFISELPARFASIVNPTAPDVGQRALAEVVEQIKARFRGEEP